MTKALFLILLLPIVLFAQSPTPAPKPDVWKSVRFLIGKWEGTGNGEPGKSIVEREYKLILNDKFIQVNNTSTYAPQEKNPKGEVHVDIGYISYDKGRKLLMLRQFHIEGFVNTFSNTNISEDGKTVVFTTESIENIPAGYKAKETYRLINENEFTETFEIAAPGKDYVLYSENKFKRKK